MSDDEMEYNKTEQRIKERKSKALDRFVEFNWMTKETYNKSVENILLWLNDRFGAEYAKWCDGRFPTGREFGRRPFLPRDTRLHIPDDDLIVINGNDWRTRSGKLGEIDRPLVTHVHGEADTWMKFMVPPKCVLLVLGLFTREKRSSVTTVMFKAADRLLLPIQTVSMMVNIGEITMGYFDIPVTVVSDTPVEVILNTNIEYHEIDESFGIIGELFGPWETLIKNE